MKIKVPELKVDLEEMDGSLLTKINEIYAKYTKEDSGLSKYLYEILTVSIACGKTGKVLKELEAHWDNHLSKEWSCVLGTDSTYFMLYNLGEKLGIVYL